MRVSRYRPSVLFDALLDNAMWNGEHLIDKSRKVCKFALHILRGIDGASWLLRHDSRSVPCRASKVNGLASCGPIT